MTEFNQNFSMYQGDSKRIIVDVTKEDGLPLDLRGATAKWGVRRHEHSTTNDLLKTTPNIEIVDSQVIIKLLPDDTKGLLGTYHHECELTDNAGNVSTIFTGVVKIYRSGV